jgi:hypothetical protein
MLTDPKTALKRAIDAAVAVAKSAKRPQREAIRKLLEAAIDEIRWVEIMADDREMPVRQDGQNVYAFGPSTRANLPPSPPSPLVKLIRGIK